MEKVPTVLRVDKRQFTRLIQDLSGYTEKEAENCIEAFCLGIETWLRAMIHDIPEESKVSLTFQGFGKWEVAFARKGKLSPWRERHGIPQPPRIVQISFTPSTGILKEMRDRNNPIMKPYREKYNAARDRIRETWLQTTGQKPDQYSTGLKEAYRQTQGEPLQSGGFDIKDSTMNKDRYSGVQPDHSTDISPDESGQKPENQDV